MLVAAVAALPQAQGPGEPVLTIHELAIRDQLRGLRQVPDSQRGEVTRQLALRIRKLPKTQIKLGLAEGLANLSTEGDFGQRTLQEVATRYPRRSPNSRCRTTRTDRPSPTSLWPSW